MHILRTLSAIPVSHLAGFPLLPFPVSLVSRFPFPVSRFPFQTGLERESILAARLETGNGENGKREKRENGKREKREKRETGKTGNGKNGKTGNGTFGLGNGTFEKREKRERDF